jgi:fructokinase
LRSSLRHTDIIKLNGEELSHVTSLLAIDGPDEATLARRLLEKFSLRLVCVTRAASGSLLVSADKTVAHKGLRVKVADAVGAGDAFAACLAHHYVRGKSLEEISESANRFASWVTTQVGAMPTIHRSSLPSILREGHA